MPKTIDVTGTLAPGMWSYRPAVPDVPLFEQWRWATVDERGWEADAFTMATLCGTYFETAKHIDPTYMSIDQLPLDRCFAPATIARIPKAPRDHITADDLQKAAPGLQAGDALIVNTGWSKHWWTSGEQFVLESPHFNLGAMQWIVDHKISILAGDFPVFDDPHPGQGQDVNTLLFGIDALILAPLVNLEAVTADRARLVVLPIKLKDACGAPCRAVIIED